jgi:hypothetical protein
MTFLLEDRAQITLVVGTGWTLFSILTLMRGTFIPAIANYLNKKVSGKVD